MEVVVGTYEELILSYKLVPTEKVIYNTCQTLQYRLPSNRVMIMQVLTILWLNKKWVWAIICWWRQCSSGENCILSLGVHRCRTMVTSRGGHSRYILVGVCRSTSKKGGLRHGHNPKKGGLRHGYNPKKGGLRHGHEWKRGVLGCPGWRWNSTGWRFWHARAS